MERLKQIVRKKDYLVVHVHTCADYYWGEKNASETATCHAIHHWKGKPEEVAPTCMSLTDFSKGLSKIKSRKKTAIINYCYQPPPEKPSRQSKASTRHPTSLVGRSGQLCGAALCVGSEYVRYPIPSPAQGSE